MKTLNFYTATTTTIAAIIAASCAFSVQLAVASPDKPRAQENRNCLPVPHSRSGGLAQLDLPVGRLLLSAETSAKKLSLHAKKQSQAAVVDLSTAAGSADMATVRTSSALRVTEVAASRKSPLLSETKLKVELVRFEWKGYNFEVLVHRSAEGSRVLAAVARPVKPDGKHFYYRWFPAATSSPQATNQNLAALEHLYLNAVNDVPTAAFQFGAVKGGVGQTHDHAGISHAQLLSGIARSRECLIEASGSQAPATFKRWQVVTAEPAPIGADTSQVEARLRSARGAVAGAMVFFRQEPHMECNAASDLTGVARCRLMDTHGHGEHVHLGEAHSAVVVTYPGEIGANSVLLPTTTLIRTPPAFATVFIRPVTRVAPK